MLDVINLDFDYQDEPLLNKVNFHLSVGGLLHLRGANGSGKTTLLKLIAGLYRPFKGEIQFLGRNTAENYQAYQHHICFVGHKTGINPSLTLRENCLFDLHCSNSSKRFIEEWALLFQLHHHLDVPCALLSAGQRRQAGLARLWMSSAQLWLLDEPFVALDEAAVQLLMHKIKWHREQGGAVLLTSHQSFPLNSTEYEEYCL